MTTGIGRSVFKLTLGHRQFLVGPRASFPALKAGYKSLHAGLGSQIMRSCHSEHMTAVRRLYAASHSTHHHASDHDMARWFDQCIERGQVIAIEVYHSIQQPGYKTTQRKVVFRTGGLNDGPRSPRRAVAHISDLSPFEKMSEVLLRAMSKLPRETKDAFLQMVSPEALKAMVAIFVAWAGSHAVGIGEAVDVILIGIGYAFIGVAVFDGVESIYKGTKGALAAKNDHQLDIAAETMARGITTVGVTTLVIMLTHRKTPATTGNAAQAKEASLVQWRYYVDNLKLPFNGKESQGALWSKLGDDRAAWLAGDEGRITLEGVLDRTDFHDRYKLQFGGEFVKEAWEMISDKYASQLKGRVVVYTEHAKFFEDAMGGNEPILTSELLSVFETPSVTEILVKDVNNPNRYRLWTREQLQRWRSTSH